MRVRVITLSAIVASALAAAPVMAQSAAPPKPPTTQSSSAQGQASKKPAASSAAEFDRLLAAATEARKAQRWEEAVQLYGKITKLKPTYVEGYWYQGTAYYSLDDFPNCRDT